MSVALKLDDKARERFESDTAEHEMTVLRDDGLYRHLRFQKPGTINYYYDLVTWPGYLAMVGDMGDYVFARITDMFDFFASDGDRINPDYWSEKLQAPRHDAVRVYSRGALRTHVTEWFWDVAADLTADEAWELYAALESEVLTEDAEHDEHEAHRLLRDFGHPNATHIGDSWEWDLREFDGRFLWCCWAILRGIKRYQETK